MNSRWALSNVEWAGYSIAVIIASGLAMLNATLVAEPFVIPLWPAPLLIGALVYSVVHRARTETDVRSEAFFDSERTERSDEQALQPDAQELAHESKE